MQARKLRTGLRKSSRTYDCVVTTYCRAELMQSGAQRICKPVILFEWGHTRYSDIHIPSTHQFFRSAPQKGKETLIEGGELLMWLR
jgi:hypothetical protein